MSESATGDKEQLQLLLVHSQTLEIQSPSALVAAGLGVKPFARGAVNPSATGWINGQLA